MITLNNRQLCENCFSETTVEPCPHCGFSKTSYRPDPITLSVGSVLNQRYKIGGVIGKGGFGITYLAYDLKLDARLAIKEYYPIGLAVRTPGSTTVSVSNEDSQESFDSGAEKFYNEAKMVARFNGNPNIVSVHDFFYENETVYFTMGYLQGQTLKSYIKKKKITEGQAVSVLRSMSSALMASHSMNILHRDISPDNIMLCDDGSIRLLDFGAARQVMAEQSQSLSVILKQGFAPLEQYQKKGKQGPWTDIYALGATIYTALTGDMLSDPMSRLEDDSDYEANKHGISENLWNLIYKCTQLKVTDRYQDVSELKADIKALGIEEEPFTDVDEEIMDLLRKRGSKSTGNTTFRTGATPGQSSKTDPNATMLLGGANGGNGRTMSTGENATEFLSDRDREGSGETVAMSPEEAAAYSAEKAAEKPQANSGGAQPSAERPEQPKQNDQGQGVPGQKKSSTVVVIVIAAIVLLIGMGILATVILTRFMTKKDPGSSDLSTEATEATQDISETTDGDQAPEVDAAGRQDELKALGAGDITTHTNDTYKYSICTPSDYSFIEVDDKTIEMADSAGALHIAVRYMDRYVDDTILYNAYDYSNMINVRPDNLLPVEGSGSTPKVDTADKTDIAGQKDIARFGYSYDDNSGNSWDATAYIFDPRGQYGCYVVYTLVYEDADDHDELIKYAQACADSFRVDDEYDPPEVTIYEIEDDGIKISLSDSRKVTKNDYDVYTVKFKKDGETKEAWIAPGEKFGNDLEDIFVNIAGEFDTNMKVTSDMIPLDFGEYRGYWVKTDSDDGEGRMYAVTADHGSDAAYDTYVVIGMEEDDDTLRELVGGFRFEGATTYDNTDVDVSDTIEIETDDGEDEDEDDSRDDDRETSEYFIPGSDSRELTERDVDEFLEEYLEKNNAKNLSGSEQEKLCARALCYARNEIYARHGYIFNSSELRDLFNSKSWYEGTIPSEQFSSGVFNAAEKKNVEFLKSKMDSYGGYQPAK